MSIISVNYWSTFLFAPMSNEIRTLFLSVSLILRNFYVSLVLTPFSKCLILTIFLLNMISFLVLGLICRRSDSTYFVILFIDIHETHDSVPNIRIKLNEIKEYPKY